MGLPETLCGLQKLTLSDGFTGAPQDAIPPRPHRTLPLCLLSHVSRPQPGWFILRPTPAPPRLVPIPSFPSELPKYPSVVVMGSDIYVIGGFISGKCSSSVLLLDCQSHSWRRLPSMRTPRANSNVGVIDGKIYVTGGSDMNFGGSDMNFGEVFDLNTQTWEPLLSPDAKFERILVCTRLQLHLSMVIDRKIYALFGTRGFSCEPKEGRWEIVGGNVPRSWLNSFCVIEQVLYNISCRDNICWYDLEEMKWRKVKIEHWIFMLFPRPRVKIMVNYGGNLAILWDHRIGDLGRSVIWFTEIALERNKEGEIWGREKGSYPVLTLVHSSPYPIDCVVVTI